MNKDKLITFVKAQMKYIKIVGVSVIGILIISSFLLYNKEKSTSLNGMLRQADSYVQQGKYGIALSKFNKIVRAYPQSYRAHINLGKLYVQINEPTLAKVEFFRAIKIGGKSKTEAYFELANVYFQRNEPEMAQDLISEIEPLKTIYSKKKAAEFYTFWGDKLYKNDIPSAIRKYKTALKYYNKAGLNTVKQLDEKLTVAYETLADDLLSSGQINDSIKQLNNSLGIKENASAHYKLAKIYEVKDKDKAIDHYRKAFELNPEITSPDRFIALLERKANALKKQGKDTEAKYYYNEVYKLNPKQDIPYTPDKNILVSVLSTKFNEDAKRDILIPGISFKIMNVGKEKIDYMKSKVVFKINNAKFNEVTTVIATPNEPLVSDNITPKINIFATKPVFGVMHDHNLTIDIYVSTTKEEKWKLYRSSAVIR